MGQQYSVIVNIGNGNQSTYTLSLAQTQGSGTIAFSPSQTTNITVTPNSTYTFNITYTNGTVGETVLIAAQISSGSNTGSKSTISFTVV
ncbi:MAG: hypothetical protein QXV17_06930 [Candidatus Micrarchaeaceae archaeon]